MDWSSTYWSSPLDCLFRWCSTYSRSSLSHQYLSFTVFKNKIGPFPHHTPHINHPLNFFNVNFLKWWAPWKKAIYPRRSCKVTCRGEVTVLSSYGGSRQSLSSFKHHNSTTTHPSAIYPGEILLPSPRGDSTTTAHPPEEILLPPPIPAIGIII